MSEAPPPLRQQLRRGWETVSGARQVWIGVVADCGSLLDSLGNLAEQMGALNRVRISDTPLRGFPELRERLRFKLLRETDSVLGRLNQHVSRLQTVRDAVSTQVSAVLQIYQQTVDRLDQQTVDRLGQQTVDRLDQQTVDRLGQQTVDRLGLPTVTGRSAASPSVADQLEWLQDAERHYRVQFLRRKTLLLTLGPEQLEHLETAAQRWRALDAPGDEQPITDSLCKVSFFMESQ